MRKRRIGQAAKVYDVGTCATHILRPRQNGLNPKGWRLDDLREHANIVARQIKAAALPAEKGWKILELLGAAFKSDIELRRQSPKVGSTPAGKHDPIGPDRG